MPRPITVRDVAREAAVSISTVSRELNNRGYFNGEFRERVLQVAATLGYAKSTGLRPIQRNPEKVLREIAFLLDYNGLDEPQLDMFWARILHGAEGEALKANIRVTYHGLRHDQSPAMLLNMLHHMRVGGFLLVGPSGHETVELLQKNGLPCVLVDNYVRLTHYPTDCILADNTEATKDAMRYLLQHGHRHIGFLNGYSVTNPEHRNNIYTFDRRRDGYLSALFEAAIPFNTELVRECNIMNPDDVFIACQHILAADEQLSAFFCASDTLALQAMKALRELGKRIPDDVSIIGFDDVEMAAHVTPALTTVHIEKEAMGALAVKRLMEHFSHPLVSSITSIVDARLVIRDSVRTCL